MEKKKMNIFKKMYCRTFQFVLKCAMPVLPYREPKILNDYDELVELLKNINVKKVLLVTDKGLNNLGLIDNIENSLTENKIELFIYDETVANPTSNNVEDGLKIYKENKCKAIIAFGGGSVMDCAKAIGARVVRPKKSLSQMKGLLKVRKKLPTLIAIPTTAGTGSETTIASVITDSETRHKYAINDFSLIPKYAILNANLTLGLPKNITASTGMDALTHAVEAYIGRSVTKKTAEYSISAIKLILNNLICAYDDGNNFTARENMLKASYLAGLAFTKSYVGYVHAIAHSLGGKYNVAHGYANAVLLPYVLKKYGKSIYKKLWEICVKTNLCDSNTPVEVASKIFIEKIEDMNRYMNIGTKLDCIKPEDISELAKTAEKEANPLYPVPKLFTDLQLQNIYKEVSNG